MSSIHVPASGRQDLVEVHVDRIRSMFVSQAGQTTAEYALVLLVVGLVVGVFAAFVKSGAMTDVFQEIISGLVERAGS